MKSGLLSAPKARDLLSTFVASRLYRDAKSVAEIFSGASSEWMPGYRSGRAMRSSSAHSEVVVVTL